LVAVVVKPLVLPPVPVMSIKGVSWLKGIDWVNG